jgi:dipeptidyl-peptidase-4
VISDAGHRIGFVRSTSGTAAQLDLWVLENLNSTPTERCVVRASDLLIDSENLSPAERARRERLRESGAGITAFSADNLMSVAAFALSGQLWIVDVASGAVQHIEGYSAVVDPRLNPQGSLVAFTAGADFYVYDILDGREVFHLTAECEHITYGLADFIASEELDRYRGHWWSPDGAHLLVERNDETNVEVKWIADPTFPGAEPRPHRYPAAGTKNSTVSLVHVDLGTGQMTAVGPAHQSLEYLANVSWNTADPLVTWLSRDQRTEVTYTLGHEDVRFVSHKTDPCWIDCGVGVPRHLGDGRLLTTTESSAHRAVLLGEDEISFGDRHLAAVLEADDFGVTVLAYNQPWQLQVVHANPDGSLIEVSRADGYASALRSGQYTVVIQHALDLRIADYCILRDFKQVATIANNATVPPVNATPQLASVTESALPSAVLFPEHHTQGSHRLPVIVSIYGGPHHAEVIASRVHYSTNQWLANQGFAVVVLDNRGTPGKGPAWERAVAGNLADPVLEDQVAGLKAILAQYPDDMDGERVGIRGWSFGGYLTALAVLERPDVYAAGWSGAPVTDWKLYDTAYTERYLGHPADQAEEYKQSSLGHRASKLERPLTLIHGLADDNVLAANSLQLSGALLASGKAHGFLPLAGVSHMTPQVAVARNLLLLMRDFFKSNL